MSNVSRRTLLGAASAICVIAPASASGLAEAISTSSQIEDPIFAALRQQHERWVALHAAMEALDNAEEIYGFKSPEATSADALANIACHAESEGRAAVLDVVPTTMTGLSAYLAYVESPEGFGSMPVQGDELTSLVGTVRQFVTARTAEWA